MKLDRPGYELDLDLYVMYHASARHLEPLIESAKAQGRKAEAEMYEHFKASDLKMAERYRARVLSVGAELERIKAEWAPMPPVEGTPV